jgi:DNA gyrase subunit B
VDDERLEFRDIILALLENALEEAQSGHASVIGVELGADRVKVSDDGRGLPVHPHPQSARPLVEVIMTGARRGPRNTLARINSACLWVDVEINRDGGLFFQRFEYARPATELEARGSATRSGTTISCAPAVGEAPRFDDLRDYLRTLSEDGFARQVKIRLQDTREKREEIIVIDANGA